MKLIIPGNLTPNNLNLYRLDGLEINPVTGVPNPDGNNWDAYAPNIEHAIRRMGDGLYMILDTETGELWKLIGKTTTNTEITIVDDDSASTPAL